MTSREQRGGDRPILALSRDYYDFEKNYIGSASVRSRWMQSVIRLGAGIERNASLVRERVLKFNKTRVNKAGVGKLEGTI